MGCGSSSIANPTSTPSIPTPIYTRDDTLTIPRGEEPARKVADDERPEPELHGNEPSPSPAEEIITTPSAHEEAQASEPDKQQPVSVKTLPDTPLEPEPQPQVEQEAELPFGQEPENLLTQELEPQVEQEAEFLQLQEQELQLAPFERMPPDGAKVLVVPPEEDVVDEEKETMVADICGAAKEGNVQDLGRLLATEIGLSCINRQYRWGGGTALHRAANYCRLDCVKLLVSKGADVNSIREGQGTPLTRAAVNGYEQVAEYLMKEGAGQGLAIQTSSEDDRSMVEGFFLDLARVVKQRQEFDVLREDLKSMMKYQEKPELLPTTTKGITIGGLRKMKDLIQSECAAGWFKEDRSFPDGTQCKGTMSYEDLTTTDVVYRYVKDVSISGNLRLIDTKAVDPAHTAIPVLFISHAWKGRFSKLLAEIFSFADKQGLTDEYAVWVDIFAVNQREEKQNREDVSAFQNVLQTCTGTLVICDFEMCKTYSRAWCLFEWDWTMWFHGREKLQFVGLSKEEADEGTNSIDVDQAECFHLADKEMILTEIVQKHQSTKVFNDKIKAKWTDLWYAMRDD